MKFTVAVDGPAAAGKGTVARAIAAEFGFAHLDTGLLYRVVARRALEGVPPEMAASTLRHGDVERDDLRTPEVSRAASEVAALPQVREALVEFQREFAGRDGGAVLDGRDIGTVICPDAGAKLFVTASDVTRAHRRWLELAAAGHDVTEADVLKDTRVRDARDAGRRDAPMKPAPDAVILDTSDLDVDEASAFALAEVRTRLEGREQV
ncbi:MAG: (d)CMP kinase [Boseongicola sp. SB0670_bin_30]|nr:(d)CMP kinase [Boseongicola sp. SB0670_bin_30]